MLYFEIKVLLEINIVDPLFVSMTGYLIVNLCTYFRLNRKAKYQLEKDLKDKFSALSIDEYCAELRNNSHGLNFKDGAAKIEAK